MLLCVQDLRDRLWDICDARKEEAEQERLDIINESWLQDSTGIAMNHFFSLMQVRVAGQNDTDSALYGYSPPIPPAVGAQSLNHWTAREVLRIGTVITPIL